MPNQELHKHYSELISRYLSGNASDAEVQELENWVLASPENKQQFVDSKKAWILSGMKKNALKVDVEQLWAETAAQLPDTARVVPLDRMKNRRLWVGVAATIALLLAASIWIFQVKGMEKPMVVSTSGEVSAFGLPDGSQITLNQASSLTYTPIGKKTNQRKVVLNGDALFDVARDTAHPFVIYAEGVEIEVLGTSFYVDARSSQQEIQVIVQSGTVAVRYNEQEEILVAGEKAIFQKAAGQLEKQENNDPNYLSIKTNTLVFDNNTVEEVIFALNRQFNRNIKLQIENPGTCELTTIFEKDLSLEEIIEVLTMTWEVEAVKENQEIILVGQACE